MECEFKRREEDTGRMECMLGDCRCARASRAEAAEKRVAELEGLVKRMADGLQLFARFVSLESPHEKFFVMLTRNRDIRQAADLVKEARELVK
jgi:hypothetical protein